MSITSGIKINCYLMFLMITTLGCSIYSGIIIKHNSLRDELTQSRDCMSIYIYLLSITFISACLGIYLLGFLVCKWLCQSVCRIKTGLNFSLTKLGGVILFLGLNIWGYYLIFFHLNQECKDYLNDNKNIQAVYLSYMLSFGLILLWSFFRICTSSCHRDTETQRLVKKNEVSSGSQPKENFYQTPATQPIQGSEIRYASVV